MLSAVRVMVTVVMAVLAGIGVSCKPRRDAAVAATNEVRGAPVAGKAAAVATNTEQRTVGTAQLEDGFLMLGFDALSNFKYDTYEVYDEASGGRPLTKSDDVIPPEVKAHHGKRVVIKGFIMPLRLKKGLVTEFLLYRDQAACCFGKAAKMNHYMRVTVEKGFPPGSTFTHKVYGTLAVGEIYVQGYLTGIYQMTAEKVVEEP
jgi:hypothetical protein